MESPYQSQHIFNQLCLNLCIGSINHDLIGEIKKHIESGADLNYDYDDQTPFLFLASTCLDLVEFCIQHGADLNKEDSFGRTPLQLLLVKPTIWEDHEHILDLIIDKGDWYNPTVGHPEKPGFRSVFDLMCDHIDELESGGNYWLPISKCIKTGRVVWDSRPNDIEFTTFQLLLSKYIYWQQSHWDQLKYLIDYVSYHTPGVSFIDKNINGYDLVHRQKRRSILHIELVIFSLCEIDILLEQIDLNSTKHQILLGLITLNGLFFTLIPKDRQILSLANAFYRSSEYSNDHLGLINEKFHDKLTKSGTKTKMAITHDPDNN
jgi:hypothetical protein